MKVRIVNVRFKLFEFVFVPACQQTGLSFKEEIFRDTRPSAPQSYCSF